MKPTADVLNHLLRQNSWATDLLRPHAGKVVRISVPPASSTLLIEACGEFSSASAGATPDAEIALSPTGALRALLQPDAASSLVDIQGDIEVGSAVGKVLRGLRWDVEADLSRVLGDMPAHELARAGSHFREEVHARALSLAGMLSEYWLEERPQIAKKRHIEHFAQEVDALRDDVARFEKRLERLEKKA